MPCDSIITQSVDLEKCSDVALLADAASKVDMRGCRLNGRVITGDKRIVGLVADALKRQYSELSIYKAAKARGWVVKKVAENKLQVIRRF